VELDGCLVKVSWLRKLVSVFWWVVLYRWRSLEATVRIRLKTRGRRLKSKNLRTPENS